MHRHGFAEIRTPVLEPTGLVARGIGELTDIVSKEMFTFERGDTSYVLRPELTAPHHARISAASHGTEARGCSGFTTSGHVSERNALRRDDTGNSISLVLKS